jgi:hypothetical protein
MKPVKQKLESVSRKDAKPQRTAKEYFQIKAFLCVLASLREIVFSSNQAGALS